MGFLDYLSDLYDALAVQTAEAEEQQQDDSGDDGDSGEEEKGGDSGEGEDSGESKEDGGDGEGEGGEEEGGDDEGGDDEEEEEEEEEEEDEPEDVKEKLEAECMKTAQCAPLKHHYDECAERVQQQTEEKGKAEEDCVEEYFHMMHCAAQCAAPKLFKMLR